MKMPHFFSVICVLACLLTTVQAFPSLPPSSTNSNSNTISDDDRRDSGATSGNTPLNPNDLSISSSTKVSERATMSQDQRLGAGSSVTEYDTPNEALKDNSWFHSPAVFADYSYSTANDRRAFGLDSDQHDVNVGFDFLTVYDIIAGMMITYSPIPISTAPLTTSPEHVSAQTPTPFNFPGIFPSSSMTGSLPEPHSPTH